MVLYILSQIFGGIALILALLVYVQKDRKKLLIFGTITNATLTISFLFLQSWIAAALFGLASLRMLTFYFMDKKNTRLGISIAILVAFLLANVVSTLFTWTWWYDFLLMAAACAFTFGVWMKGEHLVRINNLIYASLLVYHNIIIANWMGLAVSICLIISVVIFYMQKAVKHFRREKNSGVKSHEMRLYSKPFLLIESGIKTIEYRLNDLKRQSIRVGDSITFYELPEEKNTIKVTVLGLKKYKNLLEMYTDTFEEYLKDFYVNPQSAVDDTTYFADADIQKFGCLAIRFRKE